MRLTKRTKASLRLLRLLMVAGLTTTVSLGLMGCGLMSNTGQSLESASAQVSALEGVKSAVVKEGGAWSGFTRNTYIAVQITFETGAVVKDPEVFVDYLFAVAWSQNENATNLGVLLSIHGDQGSHGVIDLKAAAEAAGWRVGTAANASYVSVENSEAEARFGSWPGEIPELPHSLK